MPHRAMHRLVLKRKVLFQNGGEVERALGLEYDVITQIGVRMDFDKEDFCICGMASRAHQGARYHDPRCAQSDMVYRPYRGEWEDGDGYVVWKYVWWGPPSEWEDRGHHVYYCEEVGRKKR